MSVRNVLQDRQTINAQKIPHPESTRFDNDDGNYDGSEGTNTFETPHAKRRKVESFTFSSPPSSTQYPGQKKVTPPAKLRSANPFVTEVPDSEDEEHGAPKRNSNNDQDETLQPTSQLEAALPHITADAEAIEAYETHRFAELEERTSQAEGADALQSRIDSRDWTRGRSSIYVDAFNLALQTVLADEDHLFDEAEKKVFQYWHNLTYEAQYLYARLFLRKTSTWFRIDKIGYHGDIANLEAAVKELQVIQQLPQRSELELFPGETTIPDEAQPLGPSFTFAECSNDQIKTLDEASSLLLLDELKVIARDVKVQGKNKTELLRNLRRTSSKQRGLAFIRRSETEDSVASDGSIRGVDDNTNGDETPEGATTPGNDTNRDEYFTKKILDQVGSCIRLSIVPLKLFERVHLVFYRSTEWTEKSLITLILAKISRRNFPDYIVSRSATIFESRSLLLEFEASLRTQFRVDNILEFNGTPTRRGLEEVRSTFEAVYPRWKELVVKEQLKEDSIYESGEGAYLRRFSPAWVYTRIVHKALFILARFKEHLREHSLLCELLDQRLFHAARRGPWYQRKALLEEHYMHALRPNEGLNEEANKKHWKNVSLRTCEEGLQDNECHVIYHYDLQKRIKKLEKQLRVPKREQHEFGHVGLLKAGERTVQAPKIEKEDLTRKNSLRRKGSASDEGERDRSRSRSRERSISTVAGSAAATSTSDSTSKRVSTKTVWLDHLDTNLPVRVESMCLSHYRKVLDWKGYHSEGGILRLLFGLLFCDVLFASYVPNVFQTAYQTCPLDLHTDAFYSARISEINALINRIANGEAADIIRATWEAHYERRTCIVGVHWDEYVLEDVLEIARCWNGEALGTVMRVFAQEYASRGGGVPDLFLWKVHAEEHRAEHGHGRVMFSEVKSEHDRLSDTQRLWISVLLNAGVEVELCHAVASEIIT